jgi:hypothetical protein
MLRQDSTGLRNEWRPPCSERKCRPAYIDDPADPARIILLAKFQRFPNRALGFAFFCDEYEGGFPPQPPTTNSNSTHGFVGIANTQRFGADGKAHLSPGMLWPSGRSFRAPARASPAHNKRHMKKADRERNQLIYRVYFNLPATVKIR